MGLALKRLGGINSPKNRRQKKKTEGRGGQSDPKKENGGEELFDKEKGSGCLKISPSRSDQRGKWPTQPVQPPKPTRIYGGQRKTHAERGGRGDAILC